MTAAPLRLLTRDDQAVLDDFLYEALWDPPGQPRRDRAVLENPFIRAYVEHWTSRPDDLAYGACDAHGTIVGVAWVRLLLPPLQGGAFYDDRTPQLGIAVLPAFQRRGIGERLLRRLLEDLARKHPAVSLGAHPRNPALHLYRKCGFVPFAEGKGGYLNLVLKFALPVER